MCFEVQQRKIARKIREKKNSKFLLLFVALLFLVFHLPEALFVDSLHVLLFLILFFVGFLLVVLLQTRVPLLLHLILLLVLLLLVFLYLFLVVRSQQTHICQKVSPLLEIML